MEKTEARFCTSDAPIVVPPSAPAIGKPSERLSTGLGSRPAWMSSARERATSSTRARSSGLLASVAATAMSEVSGVAGSHAAIDSMGASQSAASPARWARNSCDRWMSLVASVETQAAVPATMSRSMAGLRTAATCRGVRKVC
jgi:hypothetical protein